jgi:enterochelin esterase family protein
MIAEKKAVPMIVVMPFGHALPYGVAGGRGAESNTLVFERYLLTDVIPQMEAKYRIAANRESRGIAGNSMGGEQALAIGLGHMEVFSAIGALSPSMPREVTDRLTAATADAKTVNAKMKTLWIACGRQDPQHLNASRRIAETLEQHGVKRVYFETEGAHNYAIWQQQMAELLPLLFR